MADGLLNKASIILTPTGYKAGTLYNVAPVVEPYEDFDFARASVASRVNSSGLVEMVGRTLSSELVTCGDFSCADPNDYWTIENTWTFGSGVANGNGANGSSEQLVQSNVTTIGKTYLVSYEILNYVSGSIFLPNVGSVKSGNGIHTEYITATQTDLKVTGINFNGSITNVSVKEVIDTNNIPRISYDSNGDNGHILLEPTSTNLITYSEDFSDSSWINTYTITPNSIISPDGTLNAYKITLGTGNGNLRTLNSVSSNTDYVFSFYAKRGTASEMKYRVFDFTNPYADIIPKTSYYSQTNTDSWVRIEVPFTTGASTTSIGCYIDSDSQGDGDFYAWGAQLEALSYATSYIPTLTGSPETRATETATGAGSADLINSTEGVLYAEIAALVNSGLVRYLGLNDGSNNNRVVILNDGTANRIRAIVSSGGTKYADLFYNVTDVTDFHKVAVKYKANDFALWIDGVERATDTSGSAPIGLNDLEFDLNSGGAFYGKCKALAVFNEALSDDELNNLTG